MLALGNTSIRQIAFRTGFADQSHMARCVRRFMGVSPGAIFKNTK
ncbi:MAG: helix-turn-helix domain-containing protein [Candidatus Eremiobacteraeota bacterium]|nr:helix-turn-helix domain-containing protein [Candidatus Eremiobacteraeota bacterium]